jgi:hypothetical protein
MWNRQIEAIMARAAPRIPSARDVRSQLRPNIDDTPPPGIRAVQLHMRAIRGRTRLST